ncbi:hypothetical protein B005_3388 [Nocardiopsis alba ATCC BAA-2165]|uniref:Uncharacterized protein n=1 Tax=Nocardiopsis alba (strain ATCC BAA-2165 / BE74) TaxID=1205910 RepID=J7L7C0_NOCAA|nr:hypothetical protein B005_3388 [Nocardiopsis alba ATCC BAA-2165]
MGPGSAPTPKGGALFDVRRERFGGLRAVGGALRSPAREAGAQGFDSR